MNYLLDTCVLSEIRKHDATPAVIDWIRQTDESRLYLSVLTLGEIRKGIAKLAESPRKHVLRDWLEQNLRQRFSARILPVDEEVALEWGTLQGDALRRGQPAPVVDSLLAATALRHHLIMVTRNVADFERFPVRVVNPWVVQDT